MKTLFVNRNNIVSILTMLVLLSLILTSVPTLANEFEVGTQFGISHLIPEGDDSTTSSTYIRLPSGTFLDTGFSPTSLYATWFPNKQFAIGPKFSFGSTSTPIAFLGAEESLNFTTLHLGGRASYFLLSHSVSSTYAFCEFSLTTMFVADEEIESAITTSFAAGLGYQWRIGPAFVLRTEGRYQRLSAFDEDEDTNANEFSLILGIGTRFGNSKSSTLEASNMQ